MTTKQRIDEWDRDVMDNLEEESARAAAKPAKAVKLWRNDDAPSPAEFAAAAARVENLDDESWCPRLA